MPGYQEQKILKATGTGEWEKSLEKTETQKAT